MDCDAPRSMTFTAEIAELIGVERGSRGRLCTQHQRIDTCSIGIRGKCLHTAVEYFNSKSQHFELHDWQCHIADVSPASAGTMDQLGGRTARICCRCHRFCKQKKKALPGFVPRLRRLPVPPGLSRVEKYKWIDARAGIKVVAKQVKHADVEWMGFFKDTNPLSEPEGCVPGWLAWKFEEAADRLFYALYVNGVMCTVASIQRSLDPRRNKLWTLGGLYTRVERDGVRYRASFWCAGRLIDHVLREATAAKATECEVHAQHPSVGNDCRRQGAEYMQPLFEGDMWKFHLPLRPPQVVTAPQPEPEASGEAGGAQPKKKARLASRSLPRPPTARTFGCVCRRIKRRRWRRQTPVPTRNNARSRFCFEPLPWIRRPEVLGEAWR